MATPPPAEKPDRVEIWGKRVGRALGYLFVIGLIVFLFVSYGPR